jgi:hypothetical protein
VVLAFSGMNIAAVLSTENFPSFICTSEGRGKIKGLSIPEEKLLDRQELIRTKIRKIRQVEFVAIGKVLYDFEIINFFTKYYIVKKLNSTDKLDVT